MPAAAGSQPAREAMIGPARDSQARDGQSGYAMAALLVAIALMAVFMTLAMPVWRRAAQREKEAELIWRGQQYDRAIQLYRRKTSTPGAPNLDLLVDQHYLRKKYKDPITGGDFELKTIAPGGMNLPPGVPQPQRAAGQLIGGVRSRSKARSIRILNGRDHYDQWEFAYVPYSATPKAPGTAQPGSQQGMPRPTAPGIGRPGLSGAPTTQPRP
jgi:type II secretory pathway pseudopilin PulG